MSCYWNGATGTFLPPILPVFFGMCYGCARTIAVIISIFKRLLSCRTHCGFTGGQVDVRAPVCPHAVHPVSTSRCHSTLPAPRAMAGPCPVLQLKHNVFSWFRLLEGLRRFSVSEPEYTGDIITRGFFPKLGRRKP